MQVRDSARIYVMTLSDIGSALLPAEVDDGWRSIVIQSKALTLGNTKHHKKVSAAIYSEPHLTSG